MRRQACLLAEGAPPADLRGGERSLRGHFGGTVGTAVICGHCQDADCHFFNAGKQC